MTDLSVCFFFEVTYSSVRLCTRSRFRLGRSRAASGATLVQHVLNYRQRHTAVVQQEHSGRHPEHGDVDGQVDLHGRETIGSLVLLTGWICMLNSNGLDSNTQLNVNVLRLYYANY